ncbi:MAG: MAPEG family protein [Phenylobacterium sp.]
MTLSLWMLLAFAGWTLLVLLVGVGVYRWSLILSGRAELRSFPGDTPHGSPAYRRAVRAHANCIENLPVFAAIILCAEVANLAPPHMGSLAVATVAARVVQTSIHMALPETNATIGVRFSFFTVQVLAMAAMAVLVVLAGVAHR